MTRMGWVLSVGLFACCCVLAGLEFAAESDGRQVAALATILVMIGLLVTAVVVAVRNR